MTDTCGCCEGISTVTPERVANRPGLDAIRYRVGTHATFLESMIAALTLGGDPALDGLTTRAADDPSLALLDAWATVADVLTFYQERIANEGYLRTAVERRSILELARLIGYALRPGVAASAYLAYTVEQGYEIEIPAGSRAQSLPGPGELPQSFETSAPLKARDLLNNLEPRKTRPLEIVPPGEAPRAGVVRASVVETLYLQGTSTNLKANDRLLLVFNPTYVPRIVASAEPDAAANRTEVVLVTPKPPDDSTTASTDTGGAKPRQSWGASLDGIVGALKKEPADRPLSPAHLKQHVSDTFAPGADAGSRLVAAANPQLRDSYYLAWEHATVTSAPKLLSVDALRVKAAVFGHNAPPKPIVNAQGVVEGSEEWPLGEALTITLQIPLRETPGVLHATADAQAARLTVDVSVQRGGEKATVTLNITGQTTTVPADGFSATANFGGSRLEILLRPDAQDRFGLGRERRFEFTSREEGTGGDDNTGDATGSSGLTIRLSVEEGDADDREVRRGQTVNYIVKGRRMQLSFGQDAVRAREETFSALSQQERTQRILTLDSTYDQIVPGSMVLIERLHADGQRRDSRIFTVEQTATLTKTGFGITAKVTQLTLSDPWLEKPEDQEWLDGYQNTLAAYRNTTVYGQNDPQQLAEQPISDEVAQQEIELQRLYTSLESGRWLIVAGERTDIPGAEGVAGRELVMLSRVEQDVDRANGEALAGSRTRSRLILASPLAYRYKRDTVKIHGNVANSTQGETRVEVLGSGDGSKAFQQFTLKQPPVTYVAATTPSGVASTLDVRVNEVTWHPVERLVDAGPRARCYTTQTDEAGRTTIMFGDGVHGARLPTGLQNVTAVYRNGIGKSGNVKADQITLLMSKPLGVKEVINPLAASGGADAEDRNEARRNAPLALLALDRLVAVDDYEGFARAFAGIAKASAVLLPHQGQEVVHLTIAGRDDIPIDHNSELFRHLNLALREFGDPQQPFMVDKRTLWFLIVSATVALMPDYHWIDVERRLRAALLDAFSFKNRQLGQDAFLSEVMAVMHAVPGVAYVDVDVFDRVSESESQDVLRNLGSALDRKERIVVDLARPGKTAPSPAAIAILTPDVPDTLILRGPDK
jgi:predicted phage baseplate assembly protein